MNKKTLSNDIKSKAQALGYDFSGIISADPIEGFLEFLDQRIKTYPGSAFLYEDLYELGYPKEKAPWGKSIIVCVKSYAHFLIPMNLDKYIGKLYLFDRRLEYSTDYHIAGDFEIFLKEQGYRMLKNSVAARWAAVMAGLGTFGKNNFLQTPLGTWVTIDTWIVDIELEYDQLLSEKTTCPIGCKRCIDACPTKALSGPFSMDMGKCIAELTYFSEEIYSDRLIPEELRKQMGMWLYGCDICQEVCPKNKGKWMGRDSFPKLDELTDLLQLENIFQMDVDTFLNQLQPRFHYIKKDSLWIWKCNALRAMINSSEEKYYKYIKQALADENHNIQELAASGCAVLSI